jgi:hypothetical protein
MAVAVEELSPEVLGEYSRVVAGGGAAGRPSLDAAKRNLSKVAGAPAQAGKTAGKAAEAKTQGAVTVLRHGHPVQAAGKAAGKAAAVPGSVLQHMPSGGQVGMAGMFVRLIWAVALGLIVLEVLSQLTGRYFTWDLATGWANLKTAGSYVGLYPGQPSAGVTGPSTSAVPATPPRAGPVPGVVELGQVGPFSPQGRGSRVS